MKTLPFGGVAAAGAAFAGSAGSAGSVRSVGCSGEGGGSGAGGGFAVAVTGEDRREGAAGKGELEARPLLGVGLLRRNPWLTEKSTDK